MSFTLLIGIGETMINPENIKVMPWNITIEEYERRKVESIKNVERNRILKAIKEIGKTWRIAQEDQEGEFKHYQFNDSTLYDDIIDKVKDSQNIKTTEKEL